MCYTLGVIRRNITVHARLNRDENVQLEELVRRTGESPSALVREGLRMLAARTPPRSALDLARDLAGKYRGGPKRLSTDPRYLSGFGESLTARRRAKSR